MKTSQDTESEKWDVFISHSSEDKEEYVRPLTEKLQELGLSVWHDKFELRLGDSLRESINHGLNNSSYGVVILSESFFDKEWPQKELNGLAQREEKEDSVILPIWYKIGKNKSEKIALC